MDYHEHILLLSTQILRSGRRIQSSMSPQPTLFAFRDMLLNPDHIHLPPAPACFPIVPRFGQSLANAGAALLIFSCYVPQLQLVLKKPELKDYTPQLHDVNGQTISCLLATAVWREGSSLSVLLDMEDAPRHAWWPMSVAKPLMVFQQIEFPPLAVTAGN